MLNKVGAIVQARMGSDRLPGKVLLPILGIPMLGLLLNRIKKTSLIDVTIVATSDKQKDDEIAKYVNKEENVIVYRGDENNVLSRMFAAAEKYELSYILRITADNPFFDWQIADQLIDMIINQNYDYVANNIIPRYPYGIDIEVMSYKALSIAHGNAKSDFEREHVTPYIRKNVKRFRLGSLENSVDLSHMRLTVDDKTDYKNAITIFEKFGIDVTFREIPKS